MAFCLDYGLIHSAVDHGPWIQGWYDIEYSTYIGQGTNVIQMLYDDYELHSVRCS